MLLEKLQILLKSQDEDKINIILSITSQDWIDSAVLQISLETTQNGQIELLTFFINCLKKCTRTISLDTFNKFIKFVYWILFYVCSNNF